MILFVSALGFSISTKNSTIHKKAGDDVTLKCEVEGDWAPLGAPLTWHKIQVTMNALYKLSYIYIYNIYFFIYF